MSTAHGGIAQLGERLNGIQEASGSIPLISTSSTKAWTVFVQALKFSKSTLSPPYEKFRTGAIREKCTLVCRISGLPPPEDQAAAGALLVSDILQGRGSFTVLTIADFLSRAACIEQPCFFSQPLIDKFIFASRMMHN